MTPKPSRAQLQAAVQWYLTLNDEQVAPEQRLAWQRWCAASVQHAQAWARIEQVQSRLRGVPQAVALPVLTQMGVKRREALKLLLVLGVGAAGVAGYRQSSLSVDYATRTGERRPLRLEEGSQLVLNTDSRVDVRFTAGERLIVLHQGEIAVTTGKDPRPFSVQTVDGRVLALGTRFSVRLHRDFTVVSVQEHAVQVCAVQRVEAGQALTFAAGQVGPVRREAVDGSSWTTGMLIAIDWRLGDFIQELARYRPGYLGCAEAVAQMRISGSFRLDDLEGVLANLPASLPVKVRHFSRYWARVEAVG
ncbi:Protein FecR [Pseudomonas reidholzensis]|uniref:Protein FecR n=1 Tax=Pseudomonas reidholzensis TaxID=1785162 RepID=A0A383RNW7_9PSED|nr:FecR domain-containing protein [Pseudomonas reidholzensis]SYX88702.1 Protein FecR [Pseudomonas reidholzensis]